MGGLSRRQKEKRAYSLVLAGGGAGVAAVVLFVLAIAGAGTFGLAVLLAIVATVAIVLFRRTVG